MLKKLFIFGVSCLFFKHLDASSTPQGTTSINVNGDTQIEQDIMSARKQGGDWSIICAQLSRHGYGYGGVFVTRWSSVVNHLNLYVICLREAEPAYISQFTAEIINGWMEGALLAKMSRDTGVGFTTYGVVEKLLGLQPGYFSFAKKLVALRGVLSKKFELYRASIPTTISDFEKELDSIIAESRFPLTPDAGKAEYETLIEGLVSAQGYTNLPPIQKGTDGKIMAYKVVSGNNFMEFKRDGEGMFYRIKNDSVIHKQSPGGTTTFQTTIRRTHVPSSAWTPLYQSSIFSFKPELFKAFQKHVNKSKWLLSQKSVPSSN